MKNRWIPGGITILLGVLTALVPAVIFPVCKNGIETAHGTTVPMRCYWTGRAEIGVGVVLAICGLFLLLLRRAHTRAGVALAVPLIAALGIALPAGLIGGCTMATMPCQSATFPVLYILCGGSLLFGAAQAFFLLRDKEKKTPRLTTPRA
jgi:hypothetical protein